MGGEKLNKKMIVPILCALVVVGLLSGCTEEQVEANQAPEASFSIEPATGIYQGLEISFTDQSTDSDGTVAAWSWDFGDGATSTEQNPTYTYETPDTYTVTLVVTDDDGNESDPYTMDIEVTNVPPTAAFTYDPMVNITTATAITFTDNSTAGDANITTYEWDFGDGNTSNETNPTHTYATADSYIITLTVTDENGLLDSAEVAIEVAEAA